MKKTLYIIFTLILMFLMNSCVVTQEFNFEEDYSGTFSYTLDISQMEEYLANDEPEDYFTDINKDSILEKYVNLKGISKVEILTQPHSYTIKYSFTDLDALTNALNVEKRGVIKEKFKGTKKAFIYENQGYDTKDFESDSLDVFEYMTVITKYKFAKTIVQTTAGEINTNRNEIYLEQNMKELMNNNVPAHIEVKLK